MTRVDLNRVAVFVRVVDAGSFTAAARLLEVPVSTVSRAVSNLEQDLGVRLLHRTTRQLTVTDPGKEFFRRMQLVLGEAEHATQAVASFAAAPRGSVRISAPFGFAAPHFAGVIAKLIQAFPEIRIELSSTNRVVDLIAEGIDLAIRGGVLVDSTLVARKIMDGDLGVFAAPDYLERHGRPRKPEDLARHACLSYRGREGKLPWRLAGPNGEVLVPVSGPIVTDDMTFLRDAAVSGAGFALLPVDIATPALRDGKLARVLPRYCFNGGGTYLVWPSQKLVPARVVAVREFLVEALTTLFG